jgi:hypothetical protein
VKSVQASRPRPKAPSRPTGDAAKKKQTVRRTTLTPVALESDVIDAPSVDDIGTANMFDDMPSRYEYVKFSSVERIWFGRI